jgi:S1-C subfamily serine protease
MNSTLIGWSDELAALTASAGQGVVAVHGRPRIPSSGILWVGNVVVTAEHALRREEELRVTLPDGRTVAAELAGRDPGTDLAVLRLPSEGTISHEWQVNSAPASGQLALALGRSSETGLIAALGMMSSVSGPWFTWRGGKVDQFLRIDTGLHPSSSGGAVVDAAGRLLGVATSGLSRTSILALPPATIGRVVEELLEKGHIARGYLGLGLQPIPLPDPQRGGLIVLSVEPAGPAANASIVLGDILVSVDGQPITSIEDLQEVLGAGSAGKTVKAELMRGGQRTQAHVVIGERPRRKPA